MLPDAGAAGEARGRRGLCLTVLAAVFAGRQVSEAEKHLGEMALVVEAAFLGDIADGLVSLGQKLTRPVDADGRDIETRRSVHDLDERPPKN